MLTVQQPLLECECGQVFEKAKELYRHRVEVHEQDSSRAYLWVGNAIQLGRRKAAAAAAEEISHGVE